MEVVAGFQSYYRPGRWCPVVVTLTNQPAQGDAGDQDLAFRGRVVLEYASHTPSPPGYRFERTVEVPAFSTQRVVLFAKFIEPAGPNLTAGPPVPEVRLLTQAGRQVLSKAAHITPLMKDEVLFVVVSDTPRTLALPIPREASSLIQTVTISPRELQDSWAGYDGCDALVFPGWPSEASNPSRIAAIEDWVSMGGTLVMLGGAGTASYADRFVQGLLPVTLDGTAPVRLSDAGIGEGDNAVDVLAARARAKPGAAVIASGMIGGKESALLAQRDLGNGQVLFLAFDLSTGARALRSLLSGPFFSVMPVPSILDWKHAVHDHLGKARLVTGAAARPPNLGLIILLCVLYTVLVGPVNFFLLARRNRIQLAWVTVPIIVFFFSGMTYAIGVATKGGRDIARQTTLLESVQGERLFSSLSYLSIFVSSSGNYEVQPIEPRIFAGDATRWTRIERVQDERWTTIGDAASLTLGAGGLPVLRTADNRVLVDRWPLRTFDTTQFELRGPVELPGAIEADTRFEHSPLPEPFETLTLRGVITNNTGIDLIETYILLGGRQYRLPALADGESLDLADHDVSLVARDTASRADAWAAWPRAQGPNDAGWRDIADFDTGSLSDDDREISLENARRFLAGMFRPGPAARILPPMDGGLYFAGIGERPDLDASLGDLAPEVGSQAVILKVRLYPEPPVGKFKIPAELVQMRLAEVVRDNRFDLNSRRQGPPAFEVEGSTGLLIFETPFRSDRLRITGIRDLLLHNSAETNSDLLANVYRLEDSVPALWVNDRTPNPDDSLATPRNGRGILRIAAQRKEDARRLAWSRPREHCRRRAHRAAARGGGTALRRPMASLLALLALPGAAGAELLAWQGVEGAPQEATLVLAQGGATAARAALRVQVEGARAVTLQVTGASLVARPGIPALVRAESRSTSAGATLDAEAPLFRACVDASDSWRVTVWADGPGGGLRRWDGAPLAADPEAPLATWQQGEFPEPPAPPPAIRFLPRPAPPAPAPNAAAPEKPAPSAPDPPELSDPSDPFQLESEPPPVEAPTPPPGDAPAPA